MQGFKKFHKFELIYEPSGVLQLADGRFLVVEDEAEHPLAVFSLKSDGRVSEQPLHRKSSNRALRALDDLEAVTADDQGRLYAITSHSRKGNGKRKEEREQLVRFTLDGEKVIDFQVEQGLLKQISAQHKSLREAIKIHDVKEEGGFNIEGMGFDAKKRRLLVGLRSPRAGSDAIVLVLENPQAVFDKGKAPRISDRLIHLDLDGGGIRALSYDQHLGGFLIIGRTPGKSFKLWFWSGDADKQPKRIKISGIKDLRQAEGVTPVRLKGRPAGILIVSDEGQASKKKPGSYLFLRYEQLKIK